MKARWNNTWLADESARMFGLTVNGRQIVQEAQFLRSAEAAFYARRNRSLAIQFSTTRVHGTIAAAEEALFNHWPVLEDSGTLLLRIGAPGETNTDLLFQDAVLEAVSFPSPRGVSLQPQYLFRCPRVSGITPTPATDEMLSGTYAIPSGVSQVAVTGLSLAGVPVRGFVDVRAPAGGRRIYASIVDGTFSASGFTADLSAITPTTGYKLDYALVL